MPRYYFRARTERRSTKIFVLFTLFGLLAAFGAAGQTVTRVIDPGATRPYQVLPRNAADAVATNPDNKAAASFAVPPASFVLTDLYVDGVKSLERSQLLALYEPLRGHKISAQDVVALANKIAALYVEGGYELVSVQVPAQTFEDGKAYIQVIEGHVAAVAIEGNTGEADLSLLREYAARIIAEQPLRKATLERYILLMNDIPGLTVGSRFEAMPGQPGAVRLYLTILRQPWDWGFQANNLGVSSLGSAQATVVGAVNSVFQEGDQTQLTFGFPTDFDRYQYYGISQREPIGLNGAALVIGGGLLETKPSGGAVKGDADTVNVQLNYPLIRSVHESLIVTGGLDILNSNSALLGQSLSDERTRSLRLSIAYGLDDAWRGTNAVNLTLSQGVDILGARRGSIAFGGPTYSKLAVLVSREQALPWDLIARAKLQGQYSPQRLPDSEQILFGGPYFGRAFDTAYLSGDRGVATSFELAHPPPDFVTPDYFKGSEIFGYVDWGEVSNVNSRYQLGLAHAASGGAGIRIKLLQKVTFELFGAIVLGRPDAYSKAESPRLVFNFSRNF
jgi:hemolysin activation/secretion protein